MAFSKKTWLDRIAEYPTRRRLRKSDGSEELVTVAREEGTISQEGDAFSAANMNDLEERVSNEFDALNKNLTETNNALGAKQDASTAITTSNIGLQSVSHAASADRALCIYNGNYGTICASLSNNYIQFRWNTEVHRVDVYVDKTYIGHIVTN